MKSFKEFLLEEKTVGKKIGTCLYVHKQYASTIPQEHYNNALEILKSTYPDFKYTIIKYDKANNNISFLYSPDWDSNPEPIIEDSVLVKSDGSAKYMKKKTDPQIYHQKHEFVGDDYKGFDIEKSKERFKAYTKAIKEYADELGVPTKEISSRIGTLSYWQKNIVPRIK
jgi:hypothetical protein